MRKIFIQQVQKINGMLLKLSVFLAIFSACKGFEGDENYYINENDTIVNLFLKTMELSDYKIPPADNLGFFDEAVCSFAPLFERSTILQIT